MAFQTLCHGSECLPDSRSCKNTGWGSSSFVGPDLSAHSWSKGPFRMFSPVGSDSPAELAGAFNCCWVRLLLLTFSPIWLHPDFAVAISFPGKAFRSAGLTVMRHAHMMVTLVSMILQFPTAVKFPARNKPASERPNPCLLQLASPSLMEKRVLYRYEATMHVLS